MEGEGMMQTKGGDTSFCLWTGKLRDLDTHLTKDCKYRTSLCEFVGVGCKQMLSPSDLDIHEKRDISKHVSFLKDSVIENTKNIHFLLKGVVHPSPPKDEEKSDPSLEVPRLDNLENSLDTMKRSFANFQKEVEKDRQAFEGNRTFPRAPSPFQKATNKQTKKSLRKEERV